MCSECRRYNARADIMNLEAHKRGLGILADLLTFGGSVLLAIDAPRRLKDLHAAKTHAEFQSALPGVRLVDKEEAIAKRSRIRGIAGIYSMAIGFLVQLILRLMD